MSNTGLIQLKIQIQSIVSHTDVQVCQISRSQCWKIVAIKYILKKTGTMKVYHCSKESSN